MWATDLLSQRETVAVDGLGRDDAEALARERNLDARARGIPTVWHARPSSPVRDP